MKIIFEKLTIPFHEIVQSMNKWANDPLLTPLMRRNGNQEELEAPVLVTNDSLAKRLECSYLYLIYVDEQLVGEISFQIDSGLLYKQEKGSAWIGIGIGESSARGKGVGKRAMEYLEKQIYAKGLHRVELGVFAFNTPAIKFYKKLGYKEIGRVDELTYWQGKMWSSIHMEKYLK